VSGQRLRVLSYNIHKGFCTFNRFTLHRIKEAIQETQADICFLQEVVGQNQIFQNKITTWPSEAQFEFLADSIWPHYRYGKNAIFPERHHGNAILSKFPISGTDNINISTNKLEQRGLLHCRILIPQIEGPAAIEVDLLNTHLNLMHASRMVQVEKIIQWSKNVLSPERPVILAGDFNDWQGALSGHLERRLHLSESFMSTVGAHAKTFPSHLPIMTLDRVYYRQLKVRSQAVLKLTPWIDLSDHLPLFVEFEIES